MTIDEAAASLGCRVETVRYLMRPVALAPTKQLRYEGQGRLLWFIAREAVLGYVPPNAGRAFRRGPRTVPPPDYCSIDEYVEEFGIPKATLYRRIKAGVIETMTVDGRRWVKDEND